MSWILILALGFSQIAISSAKINMTHSKNISDPKRGSEIKNSSSFKSKAVVATIHGFNNSPVLMLDLYNYLKDQNFYVENITLSGHESTEASLNELKNANKEMWTSDLSLKLNKLQSLANQENKPFYILAYSLGALITIDCMQTKNIKPNKLILLAPALDAGFSKWLIKLGGWVLPKDFLIKAMTFRPQFQAHKYVPTAAFTTLLDLMDEIRALSAEPINISTQVFMSPKDSVVSYDGVLNFIKEKKLNMWTVNEVTPLHSMKHFIADKSSLGDKNWVEVTNKINSFLNNNESSH